ncbi:hypothetical protein SETIT_7G056000v2 [Setaria italica]|uniref:ATP-dependent DNA helicase n=1 Tax=Setaria italica TaxID=4555 RepID=K3YE01_SETIT|nr:hypothetical protein SETIT_7G056000v2 [Setaria italica]
MRKFGKPDIFLTMTCNPDEIKNELYPSQSPQDRPDPLTRVFKVKLEELKRMLMENDILRKVRACVYVMEFQKKGLPHAHLLLIMQSKYKITCPEQYDLLISAELPNKKKGHTSCKNRYTWPFCDSTWQGEDLYLIYRRCDGGHKEIIRGHILDNQWVIPYNTCLLRTFNFHINVEACSSIKSMKYLSKYIYKGHDRAYVAGNVDEITQYREARWVTPPEAMWRIYSFDLSKNHPPVHMVTYHKWDKIEWVVKRPGADKSMLTAYFDYNRLHEKARGIFLFHMPSSLCTLFVTILVFYEPNDVFGLWIKHLDAMNMLQSMGKDIRSFCLLEIDDASSIPHEIFEEASIDQNSEDKGLSDSLNEVQRAAYEEIMSKIDTEQGGLALLGTLHSQNKLATTRATSGVVVSIMPSGRTAHSRFKVPFTLEDGGCCRSLIIWDEASMAKRQVVEALDNSLRDIMGRQDLSFGGKTIVFCGDFRQVLPDVWKGSKAQIGGEMVYHSFNSTIDDPHNYYPLEFLNTLTPTELPLHLLKLKIGCSVILLRNIDPMNGLCNGTRLVVQCFQRNSIDVEIVLGQHARKTVFLPRILLCSSDDEIFPFQFKRKQFPIRLSFAMMVNKLQGQTIPNVGVYLPALLFSHGQLYVAMSRATTRMNIKILALPPNAEAEEEEAKKKQMKNANKKENGRGGGGEKGTNSRWHVYKEYSI